MPPTERLPVTAALLVRVLTAAPFVVRLPAIPPIPRAVSPVGSVPVTVPDADSLITDLESLTSITPATPPMPCAFVLPARLTSTAAPVTSLSFRLPLLKPQTAPTPLRESEVTLTDGFASLRLMILPSFCWNRPRYSLPLATESSSSFRLLMVLPPVITLTMRFSRPPVPSSV